jgi:DNA-binding NtrC family response regulator
VTVGTDAPPLLLVVDDDRNTRESLRRALERDGYRVLVAADGKTALAAAREHEIDLVLTDLVMPGLGGLDFLDGLRVLRPDVPAILVSAYASVDTAVRALRRGVIDVLEKPLRLRDVRRAIKRALEAHRSGADGTRERGRSGAEAIPDRDGSPRPAARDPASVERAPGPPARPLVPFEVGQSLETLEREAIRRTLDAVGGNREAAASILGIGLATLYRRLREMGDEVPGCEGPGLFDA